MINVIISKREMQAEDIVVLDLARADGSALPTFEPGSHVDVEIEPGLVRQYSLCGDPAQSGSYRLGILKSPESRGGSTAIHARFAVGSTIRIGDPRNLFPLEKNAPASILVGGGIGVTPMISMAYALHSAGKPFLLHYCARSRSRAAFLDELAEAPFADRVNLHFDDEPVDQRFKPSVDLPSPESGAHVYVCGPSGFMTWLKTEADSRRYPATQFHQEFFNAEVEKGGESFEVELARDGRTVTVPADKTIVQALFEVGVDVDVSCEQGICGTCLCTVLEGVPDHRDIYLTDEEKAANDQITLCCSRSKGPKLVLDL
ncbi:flavodoxin reductase family protein [Phyllobacterium sp. YR531]|nr:flavodoxin reductase family protein [Phyllobacterium sp. YR531]